MHYKKVEEYDFRIPREYKAYLAFRDRLNEMGINFADQHHSMSCTITVLAQADFEVDDQCDIFKLIMEEK
jgi:hypothetical protein